MFLQKKNYFVKFLSGSILKNSARSLKQWHIKHDVTMQSTSIKTESPEVSGVHLAMREYVWK